VKLAVVLFNLGGPDSPEAVEPFLQNLFSDPAIISLPWVVRKPLARFISHRRAPLARKIYGHIGGRSPILEETQKQARALEQALHAPGVEAKTFIAMRCWHPFSDSAALAVKNFAPDHIVALPLYPQFSTTTTASSLRDWDRAAKNAGLAQPLTRICCYPDEPGFITAAASAIRAVWKDARPGLVDQGVPHHCGDRLDGGMLYLPRLFVYHCAAEKGSVQSETFKVMERRLLRAIINPAMIATWLLGLWLAWLRT
jgi:protoporphyrin/coproporphyrin ferrochelatase